MYILYGICQARRWRKLLDRGRKKFANFTTPSPRLWKSDRKGKLVGWNRTDILKPPMKIAFQWIEKSKQRKCFYFESKEYVRKGKMLHSIVVKMLDPRTFVNAELTKNFFAFLSEYWAVAEPSVIPLHLVPKKRDLALPAVVLRDLHSSLSTVIFIIYDPISIFRNP